MVLVEKRASLPASSSLAATVGGESVAPQRLDPRDDNEPPSTTSPDTQAVAAGTVDPRSWSTMSTEQHPGSPEGCREADSPTTTSAFEGSTFGGSRFQHGDRSDDGDGATMMAAITATPIPKHNGVVRPGDLIPTEVSLVGYCEVRRRWPPVSISILV